MRIPYISSFLDDRLSLGAARPRALVFIGMCIICGVPTRGGRAGATGTYTIERRRTTDRGKYVYNTTRVWGRRNVFLLFSGRWAVGRWFCEKASAAVPNTIYVLPPPPRRRRTVTTSVRRRRRRILPPSRRHHRHRQRLSLYYYFACRFFLRRSTHGSSFHVRNAVSNWVRLCTCTPGASKKYFRIHIDARFPATNNSLRKSKYLSSVPSSSSEPSSHISSVLITDFLLFFLLLSWLLSDARTASTGGNGASGGNSKNRLSVFPKFSVYTCVVSYKNIGLSIGEINLYLEGRPCNKCLSERSDMLVRPNMLRWMW